MLSKSLYIIKYDNILQKFTFQRCPESWTTQAAKDTDSVHFTNCCSRERNRSCMCKPSQNLLSMLATSHEPDAEDQLRDSVEARVVGDQLGASVEARVVGDQPRDSVEVKAGRRTLPPGQYKKNRFERSDTGHFLHESWRKKMGGMTQIKQNTSIRIGTPHR